MDLRNGVLPGANGTTLLWRGQRRRVVDVAGRRCDEAQACELARRGARGSVDRHRRRRLAGPRRADAPYLERREPLVAGWRTSARSRPRRAGPVVVEPRLPAPAIRRWLADPALAPRDGYTCSCSALPATLPTPPPSTSRSRRRTPRAGRVEPGDRRRDAADVQLRGPVQAHVGQQHYLVDRRRSPAEIEAALTALSVHGNANAAIPRERVIAAYRTFMSAHPDIAGYVARDLAAWQYWDAVPEYVALMKSGTRQQYPPHRDRRVFAAVSESERDRSVAAGRRGPAGRGAAYGKRGRRPAQVAACIIQAGSRGAERARGSYPNMKRWLHEPLVHFLLLGALLFAVYTDRGRGGVESSKQIRLTLDDVAQLVVLYQAQWRRDPTPKGLGRLVDSKVQEEVLYREGLAMGLDQDDTIVKRRMAQKMQFLAEDVAAAREPTAAEFEAWYGKHTDKFQQPPRVSFRHLYFSPDRRGTRARDDARSALATLAGQPEDSKVAATLADPFMFQEYYRDRAPEFLGKEFGPRFAIAVAKLPPGSWQGPVSPASAGISCSSTRWCPAAFRASRRSKAT